MKWSQIDHAIFGWGSPTAIGLFRALMGAWAALSLLMLAAEFPLWFTEQGLIPSAAAASGAEYALHISVLSGVTDPTVTALVLVLAIVAALLTALGLFSRVATIALAILLVSIHHRVPFVLNSGDTLLRVSCIALAFAPSGAACSLDRWLALRKGIASGPPQAVSLWPQRFMQFQMVIVYGTTLWIKMRGELWRDGSAAYYPPQLADLARFPAPPWVDEAPFYQIATYGALAIELALCTLVFAKPLRKWVLLSGLLLHAVIEYRLTIPLFALIMTSLYVTFYSGEEIEAWWSRLCERFAKRGGI